MQQVRPQPLAGVAGSTAAREAAAVSPERLDERARLLKTGEAALARLDVPAATQAFDRAALILHAADTEIALVRSYMQGGEYRRALAFGAHTAGAHLDVIGGSALYVWLLHAGGQDVIAQRLLREAEARMPGHALLADVRAALTAGAPPANGRLLSPPTRLAPYGSQRGLPAAARVRGSGLLLPDGRHALVPLALIPRSGRFWLRNGLGQLSSASAGARFASTGLALAKLDQRLPAPEDLWIAASDAFPGSVGYALEYSAAPDAGAAWPVLRTGFLGAAISNGGERLLGIDLPAGPRGGPVFDAAGRLTGMALPGRSGPAVSLKTRAGDRLVPVSAIQAEMRLRAGKTASLLDVPPPDQAPTRASVDGIYERGLKASLQVIGAP